jgi:hypothetical protein
MSTNSVNNYINFKILEYRHYKLLDNNLWEQYKEDFADFTEAVFKACSLITIRNLQTLLRNQGVWVEKDKQVTIIRSLYNTLCKEDQMEWTKKQILDYIKTTSEPFTSSKLNRIFSLIRPSIYINPLLPGRTLARLLLYTTSHSQFA